MPAIWGRNWQLQELQLEYAKLYEAVLNILGSTATILPLGDHHHGQPTATTFKTVGEEQVTFTWSEPPASFDTALDLTDPASFQGIVPVVSFNGSDEEADSPDATYWSRAAAALSMGMWVNLTDATSSTLMTKFTAGQREWRWLTTSGDDMQLLVYDESEGGNPTLDTLTDVALTEGVWQLLIATFDGSTNASGINLYVDGAVVASTDTDDAAFVAMENLTASLRLGVDQDDYFFDGKMAGGPLGPFFVQKVVTADEILRLYEVGRRALGL